MMNPEMKMIMKLSVMKVVLLMKTTDYTSRSVSL